MELPDIGGDRAASSADEASASRGFRLPGDPRDARSPDELLALGERYLEQTRIQRKSGAPYFIDKMPNNWAHVGLIHLILPNARIIDARRHPMSCCFSVFKQHFARGQRFSYTSTELGRYYRDYVDLMAHFDRRAAGQGPPGHLRAHGRGHGSRGPPAARLLRPALRGGLPALLRERAGRPDGELGAGPPADLPRRARAVDALPSRGSGRSRTRWARHLETCANAKLMLKSAHARAQNRQIFPKQGGSQ